MKKNKWQLYRAGVFNFWYYDEEEFHFSNGKLLLRGSNGSGKSVTMQSFIPILLDGKKSPDRLDPFGSKARRMEDYLLGEKDVIDRDERTGYLYLEYKREGTEQYLTTGIGLRAKRHSHLDFWGFVIHDNRRIGKDFFLYKTEYSIEEGKDQKIPLSKRELENRIELGGKVVFTQSEYMELVNKYVFGFESIEAYEELIKLLIQLRSPKLSKDFKPTVIYEILNESLPALSDEELRPLSDTIENMDQTKQQLDQLMRDHRSLSKLCKQYDLYNQFTLVEKADGLFQSRKKRDKLLRKGEDLRRDLSQQQIHQENIIKQLSGLSQEEQVLKEEEKQLREHDVFRAETEKQELEQKIAEKKQQLSDKEKALEQKIQSEWKLRDQIYCEETNIKKLQDQITGLIETLDCEASEAEYEYHTIAVNEFKRNQDGDYGFALWKKEAQEYDGQLENILKVLREQSRAKERYLDADKELGEAKKALDLKRSEEKKWENLFEEEKKRFLEEFHHWRKRNTTLSLTDDDVQSTAQRIMQYYEPYRMEDVRSFVTQAYHQQYRKLLDALAESDQKLQVKKREIEEKKLELQNWKMMKDPEPPRNPQTNEARNKLQQEGVPFVPFFVAVEFHEWVTQEQRERIESAIYHMGLLDSLIVPEPYLDQVLDCDRILQPNPQLFAHTLADYLLPTSVEGVEVSLEDIDNVLRSILIDESGENVTSIREDGTYQIGLIRGHAPKEDQSIYIGKEARRKYRQRMIDQLQEELEGLQREYQQLVEVSSGLQKSQKQLETELEEYPSDQDVYEAYHTLVDIRRQVKGCIDEVERKNQKVKETLGKWETVRSELRKLTENISIEVTEEAYESARRFMKDYLKDLQELELTYKDYFNSKRLLQQLQERLDEMILDVDSLKGEQNVLEGELSKLTKLLDLVQHRLQELGADEIRKRITEVIQRLSEIPNEKEHYIEERENVRHRIERIEQEMTDHQRELQMAQIFFQKWLQVFEEDDKLQFVSPTESASWESEENIMKRAKAILEEFGHLLTDSNLDKEKVTERLNRVYYQEQGVLVEYRLTQETTLEVTDLPVIVDDEMLRIQSENLRQKSRRIQLLMEYNGKRVSPYFVLKQMDRDIALQQQILNEKDQELYEEIIMNSVGRIIRARINRAEKWVEKINHLMSERDTSSGLTFSIAWKPKTADDDDELDTKELVDLLRSDPRLLREVDMQRITQHFRSKIRRAKELLEDKGYGDTLHQLIKEMLDYRRWFSFILYYRREGEQRKELTNHVFFTFSGGEKAMAMYIPLFSAAYSRYLEAREDAPYIISLDEAFAGVDENNIRDMFDLVEKLGFNYIMNSQALWGDYDTVSSLSICELVRPKNAPFVTVVRYHWDGKVRHLLHQQDDFEDDYEEVSLAGIE
ncbi:TIGR02680 family protein [Microaerobacter geothermalis]|uniref:TIGR02680 family protein n=1 Tax=Microaerobacter geothermalis TaxID=674972 RepID=UPI001F38474D|nr:TIGR02680 family protein [Microaerobacter geothermalis]MCF6094034.1 TIGR02680 family protein [Microaerobacter geothermalis]